MWINKDKWLNELRCGDNIEVLKDIPDESVDLIYIDPPFFSNRNYEIIWGNGAELRTFGDRWKGGIEHYVGWMRDRLKELHRILKKSGVIYVHLDWHAAHYIKIEMDKIFGYDKFQNEIIWNYMTGGASSKRYARKHDNILFYSKSNKFKFFPERVKEERSEKSILRAQNPKGARIAATDIHKLPTDVWNIPALNPMSVERLGYPTQKPEELLDKIIKASSDVGDVIIDAFCGCGTTIAVAERLNRKWIGIDVSPIAVKVMTERLIATEKKMGRKLEDFITLGLSDKTIAHMREMNGMDFQDLIIQQIDGKASQRKVHDFGIDGYTAKGVPIQVKNSERIGRNVVDNFNAAIRRAGAAKGKIYAISFGKGAYEEAARVKREDGIDIELIDMKEFLIGKYGDHTHRK